MRKAAVLCLAIPLLAAQARADALQPHAQRDFASHPAPPAARPADVATPDAIVAAFDATISAPPGGKLDRTRLASLFVPSGRIASVAPLKPGHPTDIVFLTPDAYADISDRATRGGGFFDRVIADTVERFGGMAHVYSAYESREASDDVRPFARGIKSFELLITGGRWYIVEVYWERERPGLAIPQVFLQPDGRR